MNDKPTGRIFDYPDIAQEVGFLMMQSANLEIWLYRILLELTDDIIANAILFKIDNISAKAAIVFRIAESKSGNALTKRILSVRRDINEAIACRNALAHSLYAIENDKLVLAGNLFNNRRGKPRIVTLDAKAIREHAENIGAAIRVILGGEGDGMLILVPNDLLKPA